MGGEPKRLGTCVFRVLLAAFVLLFAPLAYAEGRIQFLAARLKYPPAGGRPDDFRVRTNAALALGLTDDDSAVPPLCSGLADPNDAVRQGAAVGLKRLGRTSSLDCLRARATVETRPPVQAEIGRAITALQALAGAEGESGDNGAADSNGAAKYYVALSRVTNRSSRPSDEVEKVVQDAIISKLGKSGDFAFSPSNETPAAAQSALSARHLKGFFLTTSVEKFDYSGDGLRVRVKITVFSYPGKDLRGEVPAGAMLPGARPGDTDAENQLMGMVAARAAELFAQNFK